MEEAPAADPDRTRFLVELEFIQSLANPHYLGWLAAGSPTAPPAPTCPRVSIAPACEREPRPDWCACPVPLARHVAERS